jgi:myosin-18
MLATRCDQSLIFVGRSGSGKSHNFRNSLHYLCLAAGCPSKIITVEKLNSIFLLLEAFGNCRTALNTNATRFTNIFSLDFDQSGQIAAASIQVLMPERERVTRRPDGEPSFNVFYELVAGATGELRRYLQLDSVSGGGSNAEPCAYMTPLQSAEDRQKAAVSYARLVAALESLGVAETDSRCIWSILAAIYHLGVAGAMRGSTTLERNMEIFKKVIDSLTPGNFFFLFLISFARQVLATTRSFSPDRLPPSGPPSFWESDPWKIWSSWPFTPRTSWAP